MGRGSGTASGRAYARCVSANVVFSLCAATASLLVVVLAGVKGDWAVVAVYAALVAGFLARAWLGRRKGSQHDPVKAPGSPLHERRLERPRFRRR
jgi:hypothetical protein